MADGTGTNRKFLYEYNLKDHLGDNRVTFMGTDLSGAVDIVQTTSYYPFGLVMNQMNGNSAPGYKKNKYLYNGKELQEGIDVNGDGIIDKALVWYDYGARFYDPQIGRWTSIDPMAKKFKFCTPYNYVLNNPLRFYDIEGFAPGDLFTSTDLVAIDFGKYYNGQSILERREYGSQIYTVVKDNKTYYTYAEAAFGDVDEGAVDPRTAPSGSNVIGQMHTHANYTWWGTDRFSIGDPSWGSVGDIDIYNREKVLGYLVSPDGRITKYDWKNRSYRPPFTVFERPCLTGCNRPPLS